MVDIPIIPYGVSTGMTVEVKFSTAVNESESGYSGRKSLRDIALREYTLTINPDDAEEMLAIILACRGARWPVALRDWADNYQLIDTTTVDGQLVRVFTPGTGTRSYNQPILIIDPDDATKYLIPCVFMEDSLTITVLAQDLFTIENVRLREIGATELDALTAA